MNDIETHPSTQDSSMESQVEALQRQVFLQLVALIIIAATIVSYLYYQARVANTDYSNMRPRALDIINSYNRNALVIDNIDKQLINYGTTHPSFQPILMKHGLMQPPVTAPRP